MISQFFLALRLIFHEKTASHLKKMKFEHICRLWRRGILGCILRRNACIRCLSPLFEALLFYGHPPLRRAFCLIIWSRTHSFGLINNDVLNSEYCVKKRGTYFCLQNAHTEALIKEGKRGKKVLDKGNNKWYISQALARGQRTLKIKQRRKSKEEIPTLDVNLRVLKKQ
jgi:hypothetical protein